MGFVFSPPRFMIIPLHYAQRRGRAFVRSNQSTSATVLPLCLSYPLRIRFPESVFDALAPGRQYVVVVKAPPQCTPRESDRTFWLPLSYLVCVCELL